MSHHLSPAHSLRAVASALVAVAAVAVVPGLARADETTTATTVGSDDMRASEVQQATALQEAISASVPSTPTKFVPDFTARTAAAIRATRSASLFRWGSPAYAKWYAKSHILAKYKWSTDQFTCLVSLWNRESHWNFQSSNRRGHVYGIPQTKLSNVLEFGINLSTYMKTPEYQVQIGSNYIQYRYGSPCKALGHSNRYGWY